MKLTKTSSKPLTRFSTRLGRSQWQRSPRWTWTRQWQRSHLKTNLRWQPSGEVAEEVVVTGEVEEETIEVAVNRVSPEPPQAVSPTNLKTKTKVRVKVRVSQEAPDTPPIRQSPVAAAITDTEQTLGSVLLPSPAHGSTRSQLGHEGQTSLDK